VTKDKPEEADPEHEAYEKGVHRWEVKKGKIPEDALFQVLLQHVGQRSDWVSDQLEGENHRTIQCYPSPERELEPQAHPK